MVGTTVTVADPARVRVGRGVKMRCFKVVTDRHRNTIMLHPAPVTFAHEGVNGVPRGVHFAVLGPGECNISVFRS